MNCDGIDIDSCRNVTVSDSIFDTEDDSLVVRAMGGYGVQEECSNVPVTNCVLSNGCQGVRIGCPGDDVIKECVFSNITVNSSGNGVIIQNPKRYLPETGSPGADTQRHRVFQFYSELFQDTCMDNS